MAKDVLSNSLIRSKASILNECLKFSWEIEGKSSDGKQFNAKEELEALIPNLSFFSDSNSTFIFPGNFLTISYNICAEVVTVPGDGFGAPGHIRFSYATNTEIIRKGIKRVETALNKLIS